MSLLILALVVLIVVGIISAISYQIPFPSPLGWLRWAIPCIALLVGLIVILQRSGLA